MRVALAMALAVTTLAACSNGGKTPNVVASQPPPPMPASTTPPAVASTDVLVKNLEAPWGITFLPDASALVTERDSRKVLKIADGKATQVGMIEEADSRGEGGLLGITASPKYAQDQTLFLYYTTASDNRISRWKIGGKPEPIVTGIPVSGIHNGGRLGFGPDGYLYASTGDASSSGRSQDKDSLGGKILRMTPDGKPAPGNPFGNLVWTYGHRNVQGFGWDTQGRMWASEFGQNTWDEINLIEKGKNYGWPKVEGAAGDPNYTDPVFAFHTSDASCSGLTVSTKDILAMACLRGQRLYFVRIGPEGAVTQPNAQLTKQYGRLRAVVEAPDHSLWVLTNNHDGRCTGECTIHPDDDRILRITTAP